MFSETTFLARELECRERLANIERIRRAGGRSPVGQRSSAGATAAVARVALVLLMAVVLAAVLGLAFGQHDASARKGSPTMYCYSLILRSHVPCPS